MAQSCSFKFRAAGELKNAASSGFGDLEVNFFAGGEVVALLIKFYCAPAALFEHRLFQPYHYQSLTDIGKFLRRDVP
jgi:hypothetical protein